MENAVEALKMAFAMIVFVIALSLSMIMFTKARQASEIVLASSDITEYIDYIDGSYIGFGSQNRIVGLETIIPTLYKYYKENYTVIFLDDKGEPLELYETNSSYYGTYNEKYDIRKNYICSFDVIEETARYEPWTGSSYYYKENLDAFLSGGTFYYPSGNGSIEYKVDFMQVYSKQRFYESYGTYIYNEDETKRVIIYTLVD